MAKKTTYEELEQRVKELKQAECEHRQVVEALKKSRSKFQAAFEGSHDAITLTTKDGRFLDCNQRALKLYGLESKENFLEMRPSDFSPHLQPDGRVSSEASRELIDRVFQDGGFLQFEWVHQCKTGETFSAEVILTPIRLGEEEVLQASVRDITERKRAEQDLLKERTLLKAIIDNIPVMLTRYNPDANMLYLNKEFEKIVGWKTEEIRDIDLMEKVYPDPDYRQQAMEYMQKASTEWREFRVQSKSGEIIDSEWSNICMEDGTQIGIGIDITERKRAEEMLQKTQKELETIIDSVPALIAFKDKNNRYIRINKTYAEAINLPREAIEGKSAFDITQNRELAEAYWRDDKKVIESGIPKRNIIERFVADETRWIQTDKIPYRDERGNIIGIIAFFMDITPRVKAEEALRESEEKYRHLFKLSSNALFLFERETGQMLDLNEAGINMYGYTREEALQMKTADFSEEPDKTRQTIEEAETFIPVRYHRKKDGTGFSTEISICYFTWRGKEVCLASIRDITERIRTEEALKESEERYRTLVESSSDAILMIDTERKIVSCNQAFLNLFGYEKNEVEGRSIRIIHQSDGSFRFFGEVVYPEIERSGAYRTEWDLVRKDGTILPVESVTSVMKSPDGSTTGYVAIIRDISERRQTDEALRESEEKYRITLQSIPDSVCINRQKDGLYFYANEGFSQIMGYSVEEAEGKTPHDLNLFVNPADRDEFIKILNENGEVHGFELQYRKKDGTTFDALLSARPLKYGDEDCLVAVVKDITPIKEAEREKTKLQAQFLQAQRMESIGTLAGGLAHNFNNLLMSIIGNASLVLLDLNPDHPHYKNLKNIEKSVKSGSQVTRQLLGYAREGRYEVKPINLNQSVKETSDTFGTTRKEIRVHQDLADRLYGINADQGQIEQVLMNLYVNAADAMLGGGDLFLKTMNITDKDMADKQYDPKPGNYVLLTVRDTGVGMDKKTMERIFDPFFTTKGLAEGTGLGLASAYGIIKVHGGYIDVDSEKGKGTMFEIYLPATEEEVEEEKMASDEIIKGKGTVLLVDDEEMVLDAGKQMLKKLGYEVLLAGSGQEALELYKINQDKIDTVFLDMVMPGMGGGKTYDKLKEINPKVKVLLSSGYSIDGQAKEILKRGCDGFIQKPFSLEQLSQSIRKILDKG